MSTHEFNLKIQQISQYLHSFALNLTKNSEDAKDLYQETTYRALVNKDKFAPDTNLKAWLFTIMKNIFINNYRKRMKANTIMDSTNNLYFINSGSTEINQGETDIFIKELNSMIDSLDGSLRIPFMMHYEGYKYQEIAEELDLPLGTIKSRIFFARKELKKMIKDRYSSLFDIRIKDNKKAV
ncbi:MAG TPA: RNA polymerase sigma factor [Saprospiraceae bacterium]|nr:RNA polymerase sigma factor [Saprospiraceae bacterium]